MKPLRNRRGDVPIPSAIMVVVFAMVIAAALYIAYVYIQTTFDLSYILIHKNYTRHSCGGVKYFFGGAEIRGLFSQFLS